MSSGTPVAEPDPTREPQPAAAATVFGERIGLAERYVDLLVSAGVVRGLIGPHEPTRIWSRHLMNCAAVVGLFGAEQRVVDVGAGAGLPGLVIAIARPDLRVDLVEPLQRRVDFLAEAVAELGLDGQVRIVRGRADEAAVRAEVGSADWVTARAVAPLDRLVRWCLPLLNPTGQLALIKGSAAATELAEHRNAIGRLGGTNPRIVECGAGLIDPVVPVVTMGVAPQRSKRKGKR